MRFEGPLEEDIPLEQMCEEIRAITRGFTTTKTTISGQDRTVFLPYGSLDAAISGTPVICYLSDPRNEELVSIYTMQASAPPYNT